VPVSELPRLEKSWKRLASADKVVVVANVAGRSVGKRLRLFSLDDPWSPPG